MALMSKKPGTKPDPIKKAARLAAIKAARPPKSVGHGFGGTTPDPGSGETHNRTKNKPFYDMLRKKIVQADAKTLERLANALIKKACAGDVTALKEIGDRLDGRTVAAIEAKVDAKVIISTDDSKL